MSKFVVDLERIEEYSKNVEKYFEELYDLMIQEGYEIANHDIKQKIKNIRDFKINLDLLIQQKNLELKDERDVCEPEKSQLPLYDTYGNYYYPPPFKYTFVEFTYGSYKKFLEIRLLGNAFGLPVRYYLENVKNNNSARIEPTTIRILENIEQFQDFNLINETIQLIANYRKKLNELCNEALRPAKNESINWRKEFKKYLTPEPIFRKLGAEEHVDKYFDNLKIQSLVSKSYYVNEDEIRTQVSKIQQEKEIIQKKLESEIINRKVDSNPTNQNPAKGTEYNSSSKLPKNKCNDDKKNIPNYSEQLQQELKLNSDRISNWIRKFDPRCIMKEVVECTLPANFNVCDIIFKNPDPVNFYKKLSLLKSSGLNSLYDRIISQLEDNFGITEIRNKRKEIEELKKLIKEEEELLDYFKSRQENLETEISEKLEQLVIIDKEIQILQLGNLNTSNTRSVRLARKQREKQSLLAELEKLRNTSVQLPQNINTLASNLERNKEKLEILESQYGQKIRELNFNEKQEKLISEGKNLEAVFSVPNESEEMSPTAVFTKIVNFVDGVLPFENLCSLLFQIGIGGINFQIPEGFPEFEKPNFKDAFAGYYTEINFSIISMIVQAFLSSIDALLSTLCNSLDSTIQQAFSREYEQIINNSAQKLGTVGTDFLSKVNLTNIISVKNGQGTNFNFGLENTREIASLRTGIPVIPTLDIDSNKDFFTFFSKSANPLAQWYISADKKSFIYKSISNIVDMNQITQFLQTSFASSLGFDLQNGKFSSKAIIDSIFLEKDEGDFEISSPPEEESSLTAEEISSEISCVITRSSSLLSPTQMMELLTRSISEETRRILASIAELCAPNTLAAYGLDYISSFIGQLGIASGAISLRDKIRQYEQSNNTPNLIEQIGCKDFESTDAFIGSLLEKTIPSSLAKEILEKMQEKRINDFNFILDSFVGMNSAQINERPDTAAQTYSNIIQQLLQSESEGQQISSISQIDFGDESTSSLSVTEITQQKIKELTDSNFALNSMLNLTIDSLFRPIKDSYRNDMENYIKAISGIKEIEKNINVKNNNIMGLDTSVIDPMFKTIVDNNSYPALRLKDGVEVDIFSKTELQKDIEERNSLQQELDKKLSEGPPEYIKKSGETRIDEVFSDANTQFGESPLIIRLISLSGNDTVNDVPIANEYSTNYNWDSTEAEYSQMLTVGVSLDRNKNTISINSNYRTLEEIKQVLGGRELNEQQKSLINQFLDHPYGPVYAEIKYRVFENPDVIFPRIKKPYRAGRKTGPGTAAVNTEQKIYERWIESVEEQLEYIKNIIDQLQEDYNKKTGPVDEPGSLRYKIEQKEKEISNFKQFKITAGSIDDIEVVMLPSFVMPFSKRMYDDEVYSTLPLAITPLFFTEGDRKKPLTVKGGPLSYITNGWKNEHFSTPFVEKQITQKVTEEDVGHKFIESIQDLPQNLKIQTGENSVYISLESKHAGRNPSSIERLMQTIGQDPSTSGNLFADPIDYFCLLETILSNVDDISSLTNELSISKSSIEKMRRAIPKWKLTLSEKVEEEKIDVSLTLESTGYSFDSSGKYIDFYHNTELSATDNEISSEISSIIKNKYSKMVSKPQAFFRHVNSIIDRDLDINILQSPIRQINTGTPRQNIQIIPDKILPQEVYTSSLSSAISFFVKQFLENSLLKEIEIIQPDGIDIKQDKEIKKLKLIETANFIREPTKNEKESGLDPNIMDFQELKNIFKKVYETQEDDLLNEKQRRGEQSSKTKLTKTSSDILLLSFIKICVTEHILKSIFIYDSLNFSKDCSSFAFVIKDLSKFVLQEAKRLGINLELHKQANALYHKMVDLGKIQNNDEIDEQYEKWSEKNSLSSIEPNPKFISIVKQVHEEVIQKMSSLNDCEKDENVNILDNYFNTFDILEVAGFNDNYGTVFRTQNTVDVKRLEDIINVELADKNIFYIEKYVKLGDIDFTKVNQNDIFGRTYRDWTWGELSGCVIGIGEFMQILEKAKEKNILQKFDSCYTNSFFTTPHKFGMRIMEEVAVKLLSTDEEIELSFLENYKLSSKDILKTRAYIDVVEYSYIRNTVILSEQEITIERDDLEEISEIKEVLEQKYQPIVYSELKNNNDTKAVFNYSLGIQDFIEMIIINTNLIHNDQVGRFLFESAKRTTKKMWDANEQTGDYSKTSSSLQKMLDDQKERENSTGNPIGPSLEAVKFFIRTPIQILRALATLVDPNIAIADKVVAGAAMAGSLLGQKINIPYSIASLALLPAPIFNGISPPIPPLTTYNIAFPLGIIFLALEPLLWDLPYYKEVNKDNSGNNNSSTGSQQKAAFSCELILEENE